MSKWSREEQGWAGGVETWSEKVVTDHTCRGRALVTSLDGREAGTREGDPGEERPWKVLQS